MLDTFELLPAEKDRKQLLATLRAMDTRAGALLLTGKPVPVSWLSPAEAETLLKRWQKSRISVQRDLASGLISAALMSLYGHPGSAWERIGYPGPLHPPSDKPKTITTTTVDHDQTLTCDVVIVGSGAGGGCVAAHLASAGLDVLVLEKGRYRNEADFHLIDADTHRDFYLYGGTLTTTDQGIRLFAGSTLGGGTVINWSSSWKTPEPVLREWAEVSGIDAFVSGEIEDSLDEVCRRLNVNLDSSAAAKRDELLEEGLKRLGWHVDAFPRNVKGCTQDEACGQCTMGCRISAKQSSLITYLQDAADAGARFVVGADVRTVSVRDGRAEGVEAVVDGHRLTVRARAVVAAGGSIETPALLLRSGLRGRVGHNLRLHPATAVVGIFDDEVRPWGGVMQGRYSNQLNGPWTGGYGPTIETGPVQPGGAAGMLPWAGAREHADLMARFAHISPAGFPARDRASGRVTIDKLGVPRVDYTIPAEDEERMVEGLIACGKVLEAAGARKILTLHTDPATYEPNGLGEHERWAADVRRKGCKNRGITLFSMHQMGSCAMGIDPTRSAIGPDNESHEVRGLFVTDASTFPTPSGVNPMISIYGIANRAAKKIAHRLS